MASDALPVIAWDNNLIESGTMYSSGDATGYPKENVQDWRPYQRWIASSTLNPYIKVDAGSAKSANCCFLSGHNLYSAGVTATLEYSTDNVNWHAVVPAFNVTPTNDFSFGAFFTLVTAQYWRIRFTGATLPPEVGIWFLGSYLEFPYYPEPGFNPDGRTLQTRTPVSVNGQLLGISKLYLEREINMPMPEFSRTWVETYLWPLFDTHCPKPMFFVYDRTNHPTAIRLVRIPEPGVPDPVEDNVIKVDFKFIGVFEQ
jgi:hypothetical protein